MRGEYNGLKALILRENSTARYAHCFAHQLQLVVVSVAKSNRHVSEFFSYLGMIVHVTGVSCKRKELTMQFEHDRLLECLERGEIVTGRGKNQETSLKRPGDTRWGSHYITIVRLMTMWPSIVHVLENVHEDGECVDGSGLASSLIEKMESFDFVFTMYLMKHLLGITNQLSLALQQKDQNILLAVSLVQTMKEELQELRNEGWQKWLYQVSIFCNKYAISVPNMEENRVIRGRSKRSELMVTNLHHFRADIYIAVLDTMIREMNQRFPESSSELLKCIACLDPRDSFSKFDIGMLLKLASFYPDDFSVTDLGLLEHELQVYIKNALADEGFLAIENLGYLTKEMVKTGRDSIFPSTYRLIELALVLPVATASVERVFSAMKNIKTDLRNKMGDEWLNVSMVVYIEKQLFVVIENEKILQNYQKMQSRRMQLSPLNFACGPSVRK